MIFDDATRLAIDNLGWIDRGSLWTYSADDRKENSVPLADAGYLRVSKGKDGLFRVVHQESSDPAISIRRFQEPGVELASVRFPKGSVAFSGDDDLWNSVENTAILNTRSGQKLLRVDASSQHVIDLDISWYTNANYDLDYQALTDCLTIPGGALVLVSVQRSSDLVIIDAQQNRRIGSIKLAGRSGNPRLRMGANDDLLADDYDTLCRVDIRRQRLVRSARIQGSSGVVHQFIGDYAPSPNGTCAVARPFSGDVLLLNSTSLKVIDKASVGGQPLSICMTSDRDVVTRDWKTGKVASGRFG